uniref:LOW protein: ammonium transporter 1-like protein n=2 Tax=Noccaea caerulescens TaxID=107243 RepID=A0A1J3HID1_NOCCA
MTSLRLLQPLHCLSSTLFFSQPSFRLIQFSSSLKPSLSRRRNLSKPLTLSFALKESDSPQPVETSSKSLLLQLSKCFDLPSDYFQQLPNDLRLDLNDAAFDLSNGPIIDECGQELGETLLNLSRAWEQADTSTSRSLVKKLPELDSSLTGGAKSALGRRLITAGKRFKGMGQYSQGELQKIAKAMITTGEVLSASSLSASVSNESKSETRMFKFGNLQVAVSPEKAYVGAAIAFVFGILSWQVSQGIQNIPESSLQYANDNALLLGKSLRGSLLAMFYASTLLSGFTTAGLLLLAKQLSSEKE